MGPPRPVLDTHQTLWSLLGIGQSLPLSEDEESRHQEATGHVQGDTADSGEAGIPPARLTFGDSRLDAHCPALLVS